MIRTTILAALLLAAFAPSQQNGFGNFVHDADAWSVQVVNGEPVVVLVKLGGPLYLSWCVGCGFSPEVDLQPVQAGLLVDRGCYVGSTLEAYLFQIGGTLPLMSIDRTGVIVSPASHPWMPTRSRDIETYDIGTCMPCDVPNMIWQGPCGTGGIYGAVPMMVIAFRVRLR